MPLFLALSTIYETKYASKAATRFGGAKRMNGKASEYPRLFRRIMGKKNEKA
jgi:hypothetical protein